MPWRSSSLATGLILQFTWLCLYRAIMTKFPLDLVAVLAALFPLVGFAAGLIPASPPPRSGDGDRNHNAISPPPPTRRPQWTGLIALAVSAGCLAVGNGTNLHFLVSRIYYPYPLPSGAWFRIPTFAGIVLGPTFLFFRLGAALRERGSAGRSWPGTYAAFFLGAALAYPPAYAACATAGPYFGSLAGAVLMHLVSNRGAVPRLTGILVGAAAGSAMVLLPEQFFTWRATDYRVKDSFWTPHYRLSFISFKDDRCLGGVFNQLMIWYSCGDYEDMPRESRWTSEAFAEGRRKILSMGRTDGMTARAALRANPAVEKIVVVEIDPDAVEKARAFSREFHDGIYDDPRVKVVAGDWRAFLKNDTERYDLIYLDGLGIRLLTEPLTTIPQENFLFTREAFEEMFERRLAPNGVLAANWGSTRREEAFDILASLPPQTHRRAFWGTISNFPFAGLGLFFTVASRDEESIRRIESRLLSAGNLRSIPVPADLSGIAITDRSPFLQHGLQAMILVPSIPLAAVLFGGFFLLRRASGKAADRTDPTDRTDHPRPSPKFPVLWGLALGTVESLTVSWVARRFPWGPSIGWMVTGGVFALGPALAGRTSPLWNGKKGASATLLLLAWVGLWGALSDFSLPLSILHLFLVPFALHSLLWMRVGPLSSGGAVRFMASERAGYALGLFAIQFATYSIGYAGAAIVCAALTAGLALLSGRPSPDVRRESQPDSRKGRGALLGS